MDKSRTQLIEAIMESIGELHRYFATSRDVYLAKFKISRPQLELLYSLKHGAASTGELAKRFSISSSAISQMVDQLERKNLVERFNDPDDRRVTCVRLAATAKGHFGKLRKHFIDHLSERFSDVTLSELATLQSVLTKTISNLEKEKLWKK